MEEEVGPHPTVEGEAQPDGARQIALALENTGLGLGDGQGPGPNRRGIMVDAANDPAILAEQNAQDGDADEDGAEAQGVAEAEPDPLPVGVPVPVVEDVAESDVEEGGDMA